MRIRTRPVSNKEYVNLSLTQQDGLDHYDRALVSRKRALADARKDDVFYVLETEIKQLNELRETFISSRCADGEKFVLAD